MLEALWRFFGPSLAANLAASALSQLKVKCGQSVTDFLAGAVVGVFPKVYIKLHLLGRDEDICFTDQNIRRFLTDVKDKNYADMIKAAEEGLNPLG
jgi:hypothetical protein